MKKTYTIEIDEYSDEYLIKDAMEGGSLRAALREVAEKIRQMVKYGEGETISKEEFQTIFYTILSEHGVNVWDD